MQLNKADWRNHRALIHYHLNEKNTDQAKQLAQAAIEQFPDNYTLGMDYAKTLLQAGAFDRSIAILNELKVLPFEGAAEGRQLYEKAHHRLAIQQMKDANYPAAITLLQSAKKWPENLGVGKPFDPDDRVTNYLLGTCYQKTGNLEEAKKHWEEVAVVTRRSLHQSAATHVLGIKSLWNAKKYTESKELLRSLLRGPDGESDLNQWIRMTSNNDREAVARLKENAPSLAGNPALLFLEEVLRLGE